MEGYGRLCTAFYDLDKPRAPEDAVAFYRACLQQANGSALEAMCGSGRFLIPLLEAGLCVEGVDASEQMLGACRERARRVGVEPILHHQRLESLDLPRRYSAAFVPAGSLGLIHRPGQMRASLERLREHLVPGAVLMVELADFEDGADDLPKQIARSVPAGHGSIIEYRCSVSIDRALSVVRYDGRYELRHGREILAQEDEVLFLKILTSHEFLHALSVAGFTHSRVIPTGLQTAWLRESGCRLYTCNVPLD